jgi:hypothetical protein
MKKLTLAAAAIGLLIGSAGLAVAQDRDRGMSESAPGQKMQERGSVPGSPGASGYAPGHRMDRDDRRGRSDRDFDRDRDVGRDIR